MANESKKKKTGNKRKKIIASSGLQLILIKIMDKAKHMNTFWVIWQEAAA